MLETARLYDRVGIDRLVVSDHVVFGEQLDAYGRPEVGGQRGGRQPTGPDGHWLEPMTTLSVIAGVTERVRLATGILLAALRRPVVLAKTAATLDVLSGRPARPRRRRRLATRGVRSGRPRLRPARPAARPHARGVHRAVDAAASRATSRPSSRFERIHMMPKPLQPGGVPIWVSGTINARVVERLCRFGLRWIPWGDDAVEIEQSIATMRDRIAAAGTCARRFAGRRQPARLQDRRRRDRHRPHDGTGTASRRRGRDRSTRAASGARARRRDRSGRARGCCRVSRRGRAPTRRRRRATGSGACARAPTRPGTTR